MDELPDAVRIDSPFGKYEATWAAESGVLVFRRSFEIPAQTVPAEQYADFKQFLDRVASSAYAPVVLVR